MENDQYTENDPEFWMIDWRKYGVYDVPAVVKVMRERNNGAKVAMIGHSQGTTQTFAGMGLIPEWYDENMSVVALMGPCLTPNTKYFEELYLPENWKCMTSNGIYVTGGPNWEADRAKIEADPACPEAFKAPASLDYFGSLINNPIQAVASYAQTSLTGRFQEYTDQWFEFEGYPEQYAKTKIMDFGLVQKMKVAMYVGMFDDTCPLTQA